MLGGLITYLLLAVYCHNEFGEKVSIRFRWRIWAPHTLLTAASSRDIMLVHQGIFPVKGDGVKVQVKGDLVRKAGARHGNKPQAHEPRIALGIYAATVFGEKRAFGDSIQPGKKGEPFVSVVANLFIWNAFEPDRYTTTVFDRDGV